jgi:hypothetical protein
MICFVPLFFSGCFDSDSAAKKSTKAQTYGISAISRFFSFGRLPADRLSETVTAPEVSPIATGGILGLMDPAISAAESDIAVPDFLDAFGRLVRNSPNGSSDPDFPSGKTARAQYSKFPAFSPGILDSSFNQLFSSIFRVNQTDDVFLNPFTEARKKQEASPATPASDAKAEAADKASSDPAASPEASKTETADSAAGAPGAGKAVNDRFMIVGDLDGSGTLTAIQARRFGDTSFISEDGERLFNLFINSAAAERQRAFYIDDINGDGNPDLLVASRMALSGGVFWGDGEGGYRFVDRFLTGYEPMIPTAGPPRAGGRDILTVNARTGMLTTYRAAPRYEVSQKQQVDFGPNYILHLEALDQSADFLMAAQAQGKRLILKWKDNGLLEATADTLPVEPLVFSRDLGSDSVQAYQVGNYASVVLTSQGHSFNIANLRLFPQIFLIIGNLHGDESTDVAVGDLKFFTPAPNPR